MNPLELAHVTTDGYISGVSGHRQTHPVFGTEAYEVEFKTHLRIEQQRAAEALQLGDILGEIKPMVLRSALGQLALNAGDDETTDFHLKGDVLTGRTLLTHLNGAKSEAVFRTMLDLARDTFKTIKIGRAALLPTVSMLNKEENQELIAAGRLIVSDDAGISDGGDLLLPLEGKQHQFDKRIADPDVLDELVRGSARTVLKAHRATPSNLPRKLKPGRFLVGNVNISTPEYHVFLRSVALIRGVLSKVFHTEAIGLIAGRTTHTAGDRQFEIKNAGKKLVHTDSVRIVANVYRPAHIERAGV